MSSALRRAAAAKGQRKLSFAAAAPPRLPLQPIAGNARIKKEEEEEDKDEDEDEDEEDEDEGRRLRSRAFLRGQLLGWVRALPAAMVGALGGPGGTSIMMPRSSPDGRVLTWEKFAGEV
jgi:hypothetical protein